MYSCSYEVKKQSVDVHSHDFVLAIFSFGRVLDFNVEMLIIAIKFYKRNNGVKN